MKPYQPCLSNRILSTAFTIIALMFMGFCGSPQEPAEEKNSLTFGLLTDIHYADKEEAIGRYYRDSPAKVRRAVDIFNQRNLSFCVHLGDLVDDAGSADRELVWLDAIRSELARFEGPWHFVLGNHDLAELSKTRFLSALGSSAPHYSFDSGSFHFIVLDACFTADGSDYDTGNFSWTETRVSNLQLEWLREDLSSSSNPTILFIHQRLDDDGGPHGVGNAPAVRGIMEASGRVQAVFQGHDHAGGYSRINGIEYFTLQALVQGPGLDSNAFAVVRIEPGGSISVDGFGKLKDWPAPLSGR